MIKKQVDALINFLEGMHLLLVLHLLLMPTRNAKFVERKIIYPLHVQD
jgi:hypothetical protein